MFPNDLKHGLHRGLHYKTVRNALACVYCIYHAHLVPLTFHFTLMGNEAALFVDTAALGSHHPLLRRLALLSKNQHWRRIGTHHTSKTRTQRRETVSQKGVRWKESYTRFKMVYTPFPSRVKKLFSKSSIKKVWKPFPKSPTTKHTLPSIGKMKLHSNINHLISRKKKV